MLLDDARRYNTTIGKENCWDTAAFTPTSS
jgi:hypothetical protein